MVDLRNDGEQLLIAAIAYLILDAVAVVLRLVAKSRTKRRFALDDLYIALAFAAFVAWAGLVIGSVIDVGGTYDPSALPDPLEQITKIYKLLYAAEMLFVWCITLVKASILALYASMFPTREFRRARDIVLLLCLAWCITMTAGFIVQCVPLREAWNPLRLTENKCVLLGIFVLIEELTNVMLDITILMLPISMIRNLQLPLRQRWTLSLIFLLGGFVIITGIIKMYYSFDPKKPKQVASISLNIKLCTIELGTAIICACLPTYRPLLQGVWARNRLSSARRSMRRTGSSALGRSSSHNGLGDATAGYNKLTNDKVSSKIILNEIVGGSRTGGNEQTILPANAISIERLIEVA